MLNVLGNAIYDRLPFAIDHLNFLVLFSAIFNIGTNLGNWFGWWLADRRGRLFTIILANIMGTVGAVVSTFYQRYTFVIGRFICGTAVGMMIYVVPIYIKEIVPHERSSAYIVLH
jgi:MFS family permease